MASNVRILIETLYNGKGIKTASQDLKNLGRGGAIDSLKANFTSLVSGIGIATATIAGFGLAAKKALDLGAEGANITRLNESFQSLAQVAGVSGNALQSALSEAARGTISNTDLILSTNRAMMLGLGADAEQLARLMEVAAFRGRAMGLTTTQAFNDIVTGVGRASPMILDNLGIIVDAEKTYQDYADSIGKSKDELTKAEKTQALMNRTIEEGQRQIEEAGGLTEDTAAAYERLNAQAKNLTDTWKQQAAEGLEPVVRWLGDALTRSNDYERAVAQSGLTYKEFTEAARDAGMSVNEYTQYILDSAGATEQAAGGLDDYRSANIAAMRANREGVGAIEDNTDALKAQSDAYKTLLSNMFTIQDANEKFLDDEKRRAEQQKELEDEKVRVAIESSDKQKDLKRDLAELDRDIANARAKKTKTDEQQAAKAERIHDLNVRRAELLERIADAQQEAAVTQVGLDEKLAKLEEDKTEAIEDQAKARKQLVYDMLNQKAAQDGIISSDEVRFLQETAVQMGLVDRASADMAIAAAEAADMMWQQFQKPGEAVGDIQAALNRVVQGSPYRAQVVIEQIGGVPGVGGITPRERRRTLVTPPSYLGGYAEGGSFVIPDRYGYEGFNMGGMATASAGERVTITPKGKGGGDIVVNINGGMIDRKTVKLLTQEITRVQVQ